MNTLADELQTWRAELRITQAQAAASLDVPLSTYQGWEGGRRFGRERILRLALERVAETWDTRS